ncbi:LppU family putative lipoprotein [Rhodococcus xishaensis]|uniref:LppU protein n=1 Tax=Rhodococcus xishaensis TaxID=2487364 RepID=A0A3S3E1D8_9NOCA|nr:hypothetical protein [Rhodococcus xishaensis]RVW03145.1 hypothetical protein EGT50_09360 [Rhodococcus xishaensis]
MWTLVKRSIGAGAVAAATMLAAACGGSAEGTATAADAAPESPSPSTETVAGQEGSDSGGRVDIDVEIGDCVRLGGTQDAATIDEAACASVESNYKVVAKAREIDQCPSDVDQIYSESMWGKETGVLCLDVDWVVGGCMSLPASNDEDPQRVECDDPNATSVERVTEVLEGVADGDQCPEGGFVYDERLFTVCAETVST